MPEDTVYTVTEIYPSHVVLDGNHPLAGIAAAAAKVHDARGANQIEQRSVRGLLSVADRNRAQDMRSRLAREVSRAAAPRARSNAGAKRACLRR
jgi:FKBP-type peptidyl-prolyl cis-trans isomerase 2